MAETLRVGLIGAGANTRARHLPGLRAIDDVEVVAVANRTPDSSRKAASELEIERGYEHWSDLVADPAIDAVVVGTWPNLHAEVTVAALAAGKHVLCEARMARNLAEARTMFEAAKASDAVAQLVPSPFGLELGERVGELVRDHYIGDLREYVVTGADDSVWDFSKPLHWRQDAAISGRNTLSLGILHETVMPWVPEPHRVLAMQQTFEPTRPDLEAGDYRAVTVPDSLCVLAECANEVRGLYRFSGVQLFGPGKQVELYGSRGTLVLKFGETERLFGARLGDDELQEIDVPADARGQWNVEADFVESIRTGKKVRRTTFGDGVRYMEFTEAALRASEAGQPIDFPVSSDVDDAS